jgi:hypothetical protein
VHFEPAGGLRDVAVVEAKVERDVTPSGVRELAAFINPLLRVILVAFDQGMECPRNRPKGLMTPAA